MLPELPLQRFLGRRVYDCNGTSLGTLDHVFLDDYDRLPSWALVRTGFLWGHTSLVPLEDAELRPRGVIVCVSRRAIQRAPRVRHEEGHLTADEETRLYRHYGITVSTGDTGPIEVTREPKSQRRGTERTPHAGTGRSPAEQLGARRRSSTSVSKYTGA